MCGKEPYIVERIIAEKSWWCKNCFRCKQCNKLLNLDTYVSHEGVIYCKPHHRELFQPKVVKEDLVDMKDKGRNKAGGCAREGYFWQSTYNMGTIVDYVSTLG